MLHATMFGSTIQKNKHTIAGSVFQFKPYVPSATHTHQSTRFCVGKPLTNPINTQKTCFRIGDSLRWLASVDPFLKGTCLKIGEPLKVAGFLVVSRKQHLKRGSLKIQDGGAGDQASTKATRKTYNLYWGNHRLIPSIGQQS